MSKAKNVTTQSFAQDVLQADRAVVVDFWAPWCGPCKVMGPVLDTIAANLQAELQVVKVNVDDEPELASQYGIQGIPTLMVFQGGKAIARHVGAAPQQALQDALHQLVAGAR